MIYNTDHIWPSKIGFLRIRLSTAEYFYENYLKSNEERAEFNETILRLRREIAAFEAAELEASNALKG